MYSHNIPSNELLVETSPNIFYKNYFFDFNMLKLHCNVFLDIVDRRNVFLKYFREMFNYLQENKDTCNRWLFWIVHYSASTKENGEVDVCAIHHFNSTIHKGRKLL